MHIKICKEFNLLTITIIVCDSTQVGCFFCFLLGKCVLDSATRMRNHGTWMHMGACGCQTHMGACGYLVKIAIIGLDFIPKFIAPK